MVPRKILLPLILAFTMILVSLTVSGVFGFPADSSLPPDEATPEHPDLENAAPALVPLGSILDNTLYEDATGSLSNGKGRWIISGQTDAPLDKSRHALVKFEINSNLPPNAFVISATLEMHVSNVRQGSVITQTFSAHRVLSDWGEGVSDTTGLDGRGASAEPGDATWLHTSYDTDFWSNPGGDYLPQASASTAIGGTGSYYWGASGGLLADVRHWLYNPGTN